ncbi:conserved hypothetical protein [Neospora caninum Liverpool]|uniref:CUE domain-containing protein n=1 Tax=Neospora caninum (strain Liverpool) TaxID=572307 RepID=F0VFK3_NEOCL|nr:conserved hypothetical protein [Neospora caninum Liverpool]CBZ52497.1 conserved hypothetical protein [Neospora caninum Liverpool]CEL66474.1 TPA: hypothetical protein BN1204_022860 [Neospora caninum Liverpool]|eukprot:XP_003882529.1 conserved hypothetical protein [Neospora caninum Liverpool]
MADGDCRTTHELPCEGNIRPVGDGKQGGPSAGLHMLRPGSFELVGSRDPHRAFQLDSAARRNTLSREFQQAAQHRTVLGSDPQTTSPGAVPAPSFLFRGTKMSSETSLARVCGAREVQAPLPSRESRDQGGGVPVAARMQTEEGEMSLVSQSCSAHQERPDTRLEHHGLEREATDLSQERAASSRLEEPSSDSTEANWKVAQLAKRCRRSSVLCCRCRETPMPREEAVSAKHAFEEGESDRKRTGDCDEGSRTESLTSPTSEISHDCCSCCYCSCSQHEEGGTGDEGKGHGDLDAKDRGEGASLPTMQSTWQPHQSSSRIICIDGPNRPETFERNLRQLSEEFPCIHQGLIISLLETAENNLAHARQLVQVVSDTTSSSRGGTSGSARVSSTRVRQLANGGGELHRDGPSGSWPGREPVCSAMPENADCEQALSWRPASRKRQMEGEDVVNRPRASSPRLCDLSSSFLKSVESSVSAGEAAPASSPSPAASAVFSRATDGSCAAAPSDKRATAPEELRRNPRLDWSGRDATAPTASAGSLGNAGAGLSVTVEFWSLEWTQRMLRVIYSATSAEDAKAKASALMQEQTEQLLNIHAGSLSLCASSQSAGEGSETATSRVSTSGADPAEDQSPSLEEMEKKVELLQNDKRLLARAVKAQHERIQTLQASLSEKTADLERVLGEKRALQQDVQKIKDAAAALLLGSSSLRAGSFCRDNSSFDRPFPDVC